MSTMMPHDEDAHHFAGDAEKKVVRKPLQIYAAQIALANRERVGPPGCVLHRVP
jgi:hypothetical protein